jgi:hypothetical protein
LGCTLAQGFLYAQPLGSEQLPSMLAAPQAAEVG